MALVCPITNTDRRNRLHVLVRGAATLTGYIMVEQLKSQDFAARSVKFIESAPKEIVDEVLAIVDSIIFDE